MYKETPIIFSTPMVQAVLDGRKTMTRRTNGLGIINKPPQSMGDWQFIGMVNGSAHFITSRCGDIRITCPYGTVGDRLGVKETHYRYGRWVKNGLTKTGKQAWKFYATTDEVRYMDDAPKRLHPKLNRETIEHNKLSDWVKRPAIFLHKKNIRLWLEITEVRVERLQDITLADIQAEGIPDDRATYNAPIQCGKFKDLWDTLNAKRGYPWSMNPWVWVLVFKLLKEGSHV